jgi:hypothetical protein
MLFYHYLNTPTILNIHHHLPRRLLVTGVRVFNPNARALRMDQLSDIMAVVNGGGYPYGEQGNSI